MAVRSELPLCNFQDDYLQFYGLALADDRVAWGVASGGNVQGSTLVGTSLSTPASPITLAAGPGVTNGDPRGTARVGYLIGAGSLLVFSTWAYCDEFANNTCWQLPPQQRPLVSQTLWRVREPSWPGVCPGLSYSSPPSGRCQQLRVEPGPLRPLDADGGRIVASGDNATFVLDTDGRQLLSLPVSTTAAKLAGSDLVLLVPGALRDYDAAKGALLHSWPLPDVSFGGRCGLPMWQCGSPRLMPRRRRPRGGRVPAGRQAAPAAPVRRRGHRHRRRDRCRARRQRPLLRLSHDRDLARSHPLRAIRSASPPMTKARLFVLLLLASGAVGVGGPAAHSGRARHALAIVYAGDWSGMSQIYAVDPASRRHGQLTFGRAPTCRPEVPCGYLDPSPSPDGRHLLFSDQVLEGKLASLFVARADGRDRRRLGEIKPLADPYAAWSPASRRIVFVGTDGVHVVGADGRSDRRVDRSRYDSDPSWSSDGRAVAFVRSPTAVSNELVDWRRGRRAQVVAQVAGPCPVRFAWSADARWIAYSSSTGLYVVHPDGSGQRRLADSSCGSSDFAWSPNGRWLAYSSPSAKELDLVHPDGSDRRPLLDSAVTSLAWSADSHSLAAIGAALDVVDVASGATRNLDAAQRFAWSPRGRTLAFSSSDGIELLDAAGRTRLIASGEAFGLTWSPDATSLAYTWWNGDLKVVTVSGQTGTLVARDGAYGGVISSFVWTRPPSGIRYRQPAGRTLAKVSQERLLARWPIERLAADGSRVAFVACGHVFVWTPAAKSVVQAELTTSLTPNCGPYASYSIYSLALAGARVAVGSFQSGIYPLWSLTALTVGRASSFVPLDDGFVVNGDVALSERIAGELVGAHDLLVFGSLAEAFPRGAASRTATSSQVLRVERDGCPCPTIASSPGSLVPLDVSGNRVVVSSKNETQLLDANGAPLLTLPIASLVAEIDGSDLVVTVPGELRDYDESSGALRHAWPLPNVPSGRECGAPNGVTCMTTPLLVLQDAARGLVTYVLDGHVHVLRLADGADTVIGAGTFARFLDDGLVYASKNKLRIVSFATLR